MHRIIATFATALVVAVLAAGCSAPDDAADAETATVAGDPVIVPTVPTELALADIEVGLEGPTRILAAAGASVSVDHVMTNEGTRDRSLRSDARVEHADVVADSSPTSVRLAGGSSAAVTTTITLGSSLQVGDVVALDLLAVDGDDTAKRAVIEIQIDVVADVSGTPDARADRASAATNEQVIVYVVGNDVDPDGDLDLSSLRVVGGGALAASVTAKSDGTIVYQPFSNLTGTDVVLYEICDRAGSCATSSVTVVIA